MRFLLTLISLLLIQTWAWSHIITVSGGFSGIDSDSSTGNTSAIYGGAAGQPCSGDGLTTCDSCTNATTTGSACSLSRIYPALKMTVNLKLASAVAAGVKYGLYTDNGAISETTTARAMNSGEILSLNLTWGQFCTSYSSDVGTDCNSTSEQYIQKNIYMGVDTDNNSSVDVAERMSVSVRLHSVPASSTTAATTWCPDTTTSATSSGVCQAAFAAGDEKAYITDWTLGGASLTGPAIKSMAVFVVPATLGSESSVYSGFTYGQVPPTLLSIDQNNSLQTDRITGLDNDQYYCFVVGAINKANNLYSIALNGSIGPTNQVCVTPSPVVGLLENQHCFITTAAFGSPLAKEVETFRQFRNEYLLNSPMGISIIQAYYKYSPPIAKVIAQHEWLRTISRIFLYPLLAFSYLSLKLGLVITALIFFAGISLLIQLKRSWR